MDGYRVLACVSSGSRSCASKKKVFERDRLAWRGRMETVFVGSVVAAQM
jgi:hypothetical protein